MRGGLFHHLIIIHTALFLPLLRGPVIGRAPTILQNDWVYTRISSFFQSPIFSEAKMEKSHLKHNDLLFHSRDPGIYPYTLRMG